MFVFQDTSLVTCLTEAQTKPKSSQIVRSLMRLPQWEQKPFIRWTGVISGHCWKRNWQPTTLTATSSKYTQLRCCFFHTVSWAGIQIKDVLFCLSVFPPCREFSSASHQAGSAGDEALANNIMGKFKTFGMNTWTDEHYVKVHEPGSSNNRVLFRGNIVGTTEGYLAYSALKTVQVSFERECMLTTNWQKKHHKSIIKWVYTTRAIFQIFWSHRISGSCRISSEVK